MKSPPVLLKSQILLFKLSQLVLFQPAKWPNPSIPLSGFHPDSLQSKVRQDLIHCIAHGTATDQTVVWTACENLQESSVVSLLNQPTTRGTWLRTLGSLLTFWGLLIFNLTKNWKIGGATGGCFNHYSSVGCFNPPPPENSYSGWIFISSTRTQIMFQSFVARLLWNGERVDVPSLPPRQEVINQKSWFTAISLWDLFVHQTWPQHNRKKFGTSPSPWHVPPTLQSPYWVHILNHW